MLGSPDPVLASGSSRVAYWIASLAAELRPAYDTHAALVQRRPGVAENVHSDYLADLGTETRHLTRESAIFALLLLETGQPAEACRILDRLVALQHVAADPEDPLDGLWHYFAEESVTTWPYVDFNWADFLALHLLLAVTRHAPALGASRVVRLDAAIARAAGCILRRDRRGHVPVTYTNIYLMGAVVMVSAGERLDRPDLLDAGRKRFTALHAEVAQAGRISEYNSPPYAGVCLGVLGASQLLVRDSVVRLQAAAIEPVLFQHLARRFHSPTLELAGPHSRGYHLHFSEHPGALGVAFDLLADGELPFLEIHRQLPADYDRLQDLLTVLRPLSLDASARALLTDRERREWIEEAFGDITLRTWLEPAFCLGSVSKQDGWEQRRNLLAYWCGSDGRSRALQWRWLRDNRPCCSGFFVSAQNKGDVLLAGVLGEFTDHHLHVPADGGIGAQFGPSLELELEPGCTVQIVRGGTQALDCTGQGSLEQLDVVALRTARVWIAFRVIVWDSAPTGGAARVVLDSEKLRIQFLLLNASEPRRFRWRDWSHAHAVGALRVAEAGPKHTWSDWVREFSSVEPIWLREYDRFTCLWGQLHIDVPTGVPDRAEFARL